MFHTIPGSRLLVPAGFMMWLLLAVGAALIVAGTLGALKVRRHMSEGASNGMEGLAIRGRETFAYLLHDYDEADKPLILLGYLGRFAGGLLLVWSAIGLFVAQ